MTKVNPFDTRAELERYVTSARVCVLERGPDRYLFLDPLSEMCVNENVNNGGRGVHGYLSVFSLAREKRKSQELRNIIFICQSP